MTNTTAVVVCAHTMRRLELTTKCVRSVLAGTLVPNEMIVVIDNNLELEVALRNLLNTAPTRVIANTGRGAADARSTAINSCTSDTVAFIDDDAWADPTWLQELATVIERPNVIGAGGLVVPDWERTAEGIPRNCGGLLGQRTKATQKGR